MIQMLIRERDRLVAALGDYGIRFLVGGDGIPSALARISPDELIAKLADNSDPRLRMAITALFLVHPDWASYVRVIAKRLDHAALIELQARYMAAVYLQRMWKTRLGYYLGEYALLPDLFSTELGLPSPNEQFGKTGLYALADWHRRNSRHPFNRLGSYNKALELLIGQLRAKAHRNEFATSG
jgi:hypothetical protein